MPYDEWRNVRNRTHQKKANSELARFGELINYESSYDGNLHSIDQTQYSLVDYLNELRQRATPQLRSRIAQFDRTPENGDATAVPLLCYSVENPVDYDFVLAAELVGRIGSPAIREVCRLLLSCDRSHFPNILNLAQRTKKHLVPLMVVEIEKQLDDKNTDRLDRVLTVLETLKPQLNISRSSSLDATKSDRSQIRDAHSTKPCQAKKASQSQRKLPPRRLRKRAKPTVDELKQSLIGRWVHRNSTPLQFAIDGSVSQENEIIGEFEIAEPITIRFIGGKETNQGMDGFLINARQARN